jgi:hypothetical protein
MGGRFAEVAELLGIGLDEARSYLEWAGASLAAGY